MDKNGIKINLLNENIKERYSTLGSSQGIRNSAWGERPVNNYENDSD
jgi:hypothetical protein